MIIFRWTKLISLPPPPLKQLSEGFDWVEATKKKWREERRNRKMCCVWKITLRIYLSKCLIHWSNVCLTQKKAVWIIDVGFLWYFFPSIIFRDFSLHDCAILCLNIITSHVGEMRETFLLSGEFFLRNAANLCVSNVTNKLFMLLCSKNQIEIFNVSYEINFQQFHVDLNLRCIEISK